jgi:hypothetical protein
MFATTCSLLIAFLWFNLSYGRMLAQLYWDMGPLLSGKAQFADVLNSKYVIIHHRAMILCFYVALLIGAITTFSSSLLRDKA